MPAYTVSQLASILGEYRDPSGPDFKARLSQVIPRIMAMGLWRDTTYEVSLPNTLGYVSLPDDTDCVLAATVNNRARAVRSMWHDIRITGRHATMSPYYGVVDAGWYPVLLDPADIVVNGVDDTRMSDVGIETINVLTKRETNIDATTFSGEIVIHSIGANGKDVVWNQSSTGNLNVTADEPVFSFTSITYTDIPEPLVFVDSRNDITNAIATIPAGSGVVRYRRFRTSQPSEESTVHLLVKRAAPTNLTDDTIIYLGNIGAIKHALLGLIAEDNADLDRADRHWGTCGRLLDEELRSIMGAAKPTLNVDLSGSGSALPIYNQY